MAPPGTIEVIQSTLAPAFLITGGGIFLNFAQARLFRVTDRLRALEHDRAVAPPGRLPRIEREIAIALQRGVILRNAIVFGVVALVLVVATMIAQLGAVLVGGLPAWTVLLPFGAALASFAVAFGLAAEDTLLSFRALRAGLETGAAAGSATL